MDNHRSGSRDAVDEEDSLAGAENAYGGRQGIAFGGGIGKNGHGARIDKRHSGFRVNDM